MCVIISGAIALLLWFVFRVAKYGIETVGEPKGSNGKYINCSDISFYNLASLLILGLFTSFELAVTYNMSLHGHDPSNVFGVLWFIFTILTMWPSFVLVLPVIIYSLVAASPRHLRRLGRDE